MSKEGKIKKPLFKRWWFWLIIIIVVIGAIGGGGSKDKDVSSQPANTSQPAPTEDQSPPENEPKETKLEGFKAGMYKVGTDMPAGEYKLIADYGLAYFEITKDSSGSFDSIIANDNFQNNSYITLKEGQYIKLQSAMAIPMDKASKVQPKDGMLPAGMYKVGFDISPGEYKIIADGMGYVEISKNSTHLFDAIVTNDNFQGERYITVKEGQYLKLQGASIKVE